MSGGRVEVVGPGGDTPVVKGGGAVSRAAGVAGEGGGAEVGDYAALTHFDGVGAVGWMGFTLGCLMVVGSSSLLDVGWGVVTLVFGVLFTRKSLFDVLLIQDFLLS